MFRVSKFVAENIFNNVILNLTMNATMNLTNSDKGLKQNYFFHLDFYFFEYVLLRFIPKGQGQGLYGYKAIKTQHYWSVCIPLTSTLRFYSI